MYSEDAGYERLMAVEAAQVEAEAHEATPKQAALAERR